MKTVINQTQIEKRRNLGRLKVKRNTREGKEEVKDVRKAEMRDRTRKRWSETSQQQEKRQRKWGGRLKGESI